MTKITINESKGNRPAMKSLDGMIAAWIREDKNDTQFLSIKVANPLGEDQRATLYPTDEEGNTVYQQK